jgi:hypothetical protein
MISNVDLIKIYNSDWKLFSYGVFLTKYKRNGTHLYLITNVHIMNFIPHFSPIRSQCPHGLTRLCLGPLEHWGRGFESHSRLGCMSAFFCVVLPFVGWGSAIGQSPFQRILPKRLNGFIISKVKSHSQQDRGSNPTFWRKRSAQDGLDERNKYVQSVIKEHQNQTGMQIHTRNASDKQVRYSVYLFTLIQTDSAAHPASYPMGTEGCFPGVKATGAWIWPFTSF